ncbi:hypothetical protein KIW84_071778 [Lathyrus oleraceus]|uniref:Uncharacterized protein n=1 Tax=Pisum sativum TaxID=3888 RepID=A0A9D4VKB7_PEA|nr:hypothetical protein KIW84_071778 [Pisum sativum]
MTYTELYPSLVLKNHIQPRNPPQIPEPLPWWFKPDLHCAFHQGAPGHDIENCYPLKYEVQKLMKSGMVSFEDRVPNVKANLFPTHGNAFVNMVDGYPGNFRVFDVRRICSMNLRGCVIIKRDIQKLMDEGVIQLQQSRDMGDDVNIIYTSVIWLAGSVPYSSDKVLPYQYNATMIEKGQEVPLPVPDSVVNIADVVEVTRSGRVFIPGFPKIVKDVSVGKKAKIPAVNPISTLTCQSGESSKLKTNDDDEAHREALQKVLEQAYVEHDVTVDQFNHIFSNITYCNNQSFCDEELPEEGRNHNLELNISMNCKEDVMSNVLVDTRSSLNVFPKSTLSRLSYQGAPMRYNGMVVKAFDGSHKTVIGKWTCRLR